MGETKGQSGNIEVHPASVVGRGEPPPQLLHHQGDRNLSHRSGDLKGQPGTPRVNIVILEVPPWIY